MNNRIKKEIEFLEFEIEEHRRCLIRELDRFKNWVSTADAGRIAVIPQSSIFQSICSDYNSIRNLDSKKRWLLHLLEDLQQEAEQ